MKTYLPLFYSEKVKRPDKKYFLNNILGEDFVILLLSFAYHRVHFWQSAIALFLLQISFWCIYELGYIENDIIGDKFEDKAVLSYNYNSYQYSFRLWQPWVWSFVLSAAGIILLQSSSINNIINLNFLVENDSQLLAVAESYFSWITFLLILRFTFHVYNYLNKQSRVWFYSLLQAFRYCGYLVLFTINTVSLMLLISNILTRSIQYILYRYMGGKSSSWPMDFPRYFFCFLIFLLLTGIIAANERNLALILNYQVSAIFIFCLARGYKHFHKVFSQFIPVSQDGSSKVT